MPYQIVFHRHDEDDFILMVETYETLLPVPDGFPGNAIFDHLISRAVISTLENPSEANNGVWRHFLGYEVGKLQDAVRWVLENEMQLPSEIIDNLVDDLMLDLVMHEPLLQADT